MAFKNKIEKETIISDFLDAKSNFLPNWLLSREGCFNCIDYSIRIQLSVNERFTFNSINEITLERIWKPDQDFLKGKIWISKFNSKGILLNNRHFNTPVRFEYAKENVGNSLSLIAILALKTLYDFVNEENKGLLRKPGLLFRSEVYALRNLGIWQKKGREINCELDDLVSEIMRSEKSRPRNNIRYQNLPIRDNFLIDINEIYNLICWDGSSAKNNRIYDEKVWVVNVRPQNIEVYNNYGRLLSGKTLTDTLRCFFPDDVLLPLKKIRQYNELIIKGQNPNFILQDRKIRKSFMSEHKEASQKAIGKWPERDQKPSEIIEFDEVFEKYSPQSFYGRKFIFQKLNKMIARKKAKSPFILIIGESGIGKTSLMANYLRNKNYIHYFLSFRKPDRLKPVVFINHLYVALAYKHKLSNRTLKAVNISTVESLRDIIKEISRNFLTEEHLEVIFIDGLDESVGIGKDTLTIPEILASIDFPINFRIVISSNQIPQLKDLKALDNSNIIRLLGKDDNNKADLREFILDNLLRFKIKEYAIELLIERSEGNFQYAAQIIEMLFDPNENIEELLKDPPKGLVGIYDRKLQRIKSNTKNEKWLNDIWRVMRLISLLRDAHAPQVICAILKIDPLYISDVFGPLQQFFELSIFENERKCAWFHMSFNDYIKNRVRFLEEEEYDIFKAIAQYIRYQIANKKTEDIPKDFTMGAFYYFSQAGEHDAPYLLDL